uniref:non-specific serine/threonine protein kinase n=1 Tax=Chlamydomonas euryale TaxID=1486919 RepID=A0A7R9V354_9CHLO|mmetsp:Transcript_12640/g.36896  ORF Transcript_12640/g.36896 Transcript_12640/m.36896 type:complete len:455 (+) Transcript_12640:381-1745(+)
MVDGQSHGSPQARGPDGEDAEAVEIDPEGRYHRYSELVGRGKFKSCHKAFDSQIGIDVAWSKYTADDIHLSDGELAALERDIQTNLNLEHPNIIKSFRCWGDMQHHCINLITELFTSGNLRQFRAHYPHLDLKAVKRMARQILRGLHYLHTLEPPITHGDLRCDKIYVNGNSGEIKIGDIGLATLTPYRWRGAERECAAQDPLDVSSDIFAFGLCMLELLTLKQLDPQHCSEWEGLLQMVDDEDARTFISKCLQVQVSQRPTADELLVDTFLSVPRKTTMNGAEGITNSQSDLTSTLGTLSMSNMVCASLNASSKSLHEVGGASANLSRQTDAMPESHNSMERASGGAPIAVGKLRGEDYEFEFAGQVDDGKMNFRLVMTQASSSNSSTTDEPAFRRTIDFTFDPDVDTVDALAGEISETFNLSPTDTEICAAALREWLAKEMPHLTGDNDGNG